ncbi:MAG TPA: Xaa-Pro peptidase family protein [Gemmatimonadales bacterium]|nr:Xaa-Pro peptidase family protein [Gemmatimonadales bacterium]
MGGDRRGERQAALRRRLAELGLDGLLISHAPNIRYLSGFTGSAGLLLLTAERTALITDFRYAGQAPEEARGAADVVVEPRNLWERLRAMLSGGPRLRLGFERDHLTVRNAERLAGLESTEPVPVSEVVEGLRAVKDESEVAAITAAAELAQSALAELLPSIRSGATEREIAARLEAALRQRGSEWHPFQTIVASGPRSALPHARASARAVAPGEWLLLDFGAQLGGYCADLSRTVMIGRSADARQREVYGIVREAQRAAREGIRPGMTGRQADALARDLIEAAGFGAAFGHSLGHGLGLEVHEGPRLAVTAEEPLPAGAVVTVEPGIYLEGWGGVRLEDDIHLTPEGPRCLSDGRTELLEIH